MNNTSRNYVGELVEDGYIEKKNIDGALKALDAVPNSLHWYAFVDKFLLTIGVLALSFSLIFFIAFNWDAVGQFSKFILIEFFMLVSFAIYWKVGADNVAGKLMLLLISILMGVLLSVYAQNYSTGKDTWEFFVYWAVLIVPFALMGRFSAIWILLVLLINLAAVSYFFTFGIYMVEPEGLMKIILYFLPFLAILYMKIDSHLITTLLLLLFSFNMLVLIVVELSNRKYKWFKDRWLMGTLFVIASGTMGMLMLDEVGGIEHVFIVVTWAVWVLLVLYIYMKIIPDFFILLSTIFWLDILFFVWIKLSNPIFALFIILWVGLVNFIVLKDLQKRVHNA